jgi:hypothetical protein
MNKLIHVGRIQNSKKGVEYLFLRKDTENIFTWYREKNETEEETNLSADSISLAIQTASKYWMDNSFRTLRCGYRFELPERDEHGCNALFHQMATSYSSSGGVYLDEEISQSCIVKNASSEALELWNALVKGGRC